MRNHTPRAAAGPTGIVLAAGAGRRFGMPKVLAANGAWAAGAVAALRDGGCGRVLVVLSSPSLLPWLPNGAEVVVADHAREGLSRSVAAGLHAADGDVVLMLVDTPDVNAQCVRRVIDAGRCAPSGVARAVYAGAVGHPVYLSAAQNLRLRRAVASASGPDLDRGLRPLLGATAELVECGDLATGIDVDRPPVSEVMT